MRDKSQRLSVLIADDEPRIVQLIKELIDWEQLSLYCVGIANDGEAAKTLLDTLRPDIIITDIRMPEISGLELAQYICKQEWNTKIIIISGYKQFDYAYQALKHGAVDFLIKPINGRDLNNVLLRICEKKTHIEISQEYVDMLREKVEVAETKKRKQFILDAYNNVPKAVFTGVSFRGDTFFAVAVKADLSTSFSESDTRMMEKIDMVLKDEYNTLGVDFETLQVDDMILGVLGVKNSQVEGINRIIAKCMRRIRSRLDIFSHFKIAVAISHPHEECDRLSDWIGEAIEAVKCRTILGNVDLIDARQIDLLPPERLLTLQDSKRLRQYLETLDVTGIRAYIVEIARCHRDVCADRPRQLRSLIYEIRDVIQVQKSQWDGMCDPDAWKFLPFALEECVSFEQMLETLLSAIKDIIRICEEIRKTQNSLPIWAVKKHIDEHMHEDISLESISDAVGFSKNYLCKLFKNEMDTTIVTYITEARMETAKKLLKQTLLNISEIALRVGYEDPKYFSRQFTRFVGVTPKEYRRISPM